MSEVRPTWMWEERVEDDHSLYGPEESCPQGCVPLYDSAALKAAIAEAVEPYKLFTSNVMKQFLTDVITASGLLSYGKTDKGLAKRLNDRGITVSNAVFDIAARRDME